MEKVMVVFYNLVSVHCDNVRAMKHSKDSGDHITYMWVQELTHYQPIDPAEAKCKANETTEDLTEQIHKKEVAQLITKDEVEGNILEVIVRDSVNLLNVVTSVKMTVTNFRKGVS